MVAGIVGGGGPPSGFCFSSCVTSMAMESSPRPLISSAVRYLYDGSPRRFSSPAIANSASSD